MTQAFRFERQRVLGDQSSGGLVLARSVGGSARRQSAEVMAQLGDEGTQQQSPSAALNRAMQGREGALPFASQVAAQLGVDVSGLRCFFGPEAEAACAMVGAEAFAVGNILVFSTQSPSLEVVLHEAAHAVQQGGATAGGKIGSAPASLGMTTPGSNTEREAEAIATGQASPELAADGPILARVLTTRSQGVWVVSDPGRYQETVLRRVPLGTRVVITDRGAAQPFNQQVDASRQWVRVRVTTGTHMGLEGWVMETLLHDVPETAEVSLDEARRLFRELAGASFVTDTGARAPIPFHHPPDGCYARAHLMQQLLTEKGYASRKVFAVSRTAGGGAGLRVPTDHAADVAPGAQPAVQWWYHVAPIIQVRQADGTVADMVLDPSMTSGPVTISEWTGRMSTGVFTNLTTAQVRALVTANGGDFPNGRNIVYTASRHAYGPHDYDASAPADADAQHRGWGHAAVSGYTAREPAHELAATLRQELRRSGRAFSPSRLLTAVRRASPQARAGLRALFPNLLTEIEQARDAGRMTPAQHAAFLTELNR